MRRLLMLLALAWLLPACSTIQGIDTAIAGAPPAHLRGDIALTVKFVDPERLADECARALKLAGRMPIPVHECVFAEGPGQPIVMVVSNPCRVSKPNPREAIECHAIGHAHQIRHGLPVEEWWLQPASVAALSHSHRRSELEEQDSYYRDAYLKPATARIPSAVKGEDALKEIMLAAVEAERPAPAHAMAPAALAPTPGPAPSPAPTPRPLLTASADAALRPAPKPAPRPAALDDSGAGEAGPADYPSALAHPPAEVMLAARSEPQFRPARESPAARAAAGRAAAAKGAHAPMVLLAQGAEPGRPAGAPESDAAAPAARSLGTGVAGGARKDNGLAGLLAPLGEALQRLIRTDPTLRPKPMRAAPLPSAQ